MAKVSRIPEWNAHFALPPIRPGQAGISTDRSPYASSMIEVVDRFNTSNERAVILRGLIAYRQALSKAGVETGFQWLDGSFLENVEVAESRPPNDIDVVTFFMMPAGASPSSMVDLFDPVKTKASYHVDAYGLTLGKPLDGKTIKLVSYWYSMWSHRRSGHWKGFVQVALSTSDDQEASDLIDFPRDRNKQKS